MKPTTVFTSSRRKSPRRQCSFLGMQSVRFTLVIRPTMFLRKSAIIPRSKPKEITREPKRVSRSPDSPEVPFEDVASDLLEPRFWTGTSRLTFERQTTHPEPHLSLPTTPLVDSFRVPDDTPGMVLAVATVSDRMAIRPCRRDARQSEVGSLGPRCRRMTRARSANG